ncbi:MAG: thermonuclease family protein [Elusimicrobia bacterium]|nr:thermonuclease family protein [Elusimicrobiota bacterium]
MPKDSVLTTTGYNKLVDDLNKIINEGRARVKTAANMELVRTYWAVGRRIEEEGLTETAGYGDAIMEKLAVALKTDRSTLVRCIQFYNFYQKGAPESSIPWTSWRLLLTVGNEKERAYYIEKVEKEHWSYEKLVEAVKDDSAVTPSGKGGKKLTRPTGGPFTYVATILRVVDGDTLLVMADLGFEVWKEQRLRLACVDTPALGEDGGPEAQEYVLSKLAKAKRVVIRTGKVDAHGRYVAHVFYTLDPEMAREKVFEEGNWLNQELINRGLARAVSGF